MNTATFPGIKKMSPQLIVADIQRSIAFYTQKLGFTVDFRYEDFYAGIVREGFSIHLKLGKPSLEESKGRINNEDLAIVFSVDDIDGCYEELSNKSVAFVQTLREMPYGREFYITDPDGYLLAFLDNN